MVAALAALADPAQAAVSGVTGSPWGDLLVSQGPMGVIAGFLLYISWTLWGENKKLRAQVDEEKSARLVDANASRDKLLQMSEKVHETTDDLAKIADRLEKTKP
jgi:hypothetical protein